MTARESRILARTFAEHVWNPHDPKAGTVPHSFSLDRQIAQARREMGEDVWAKLKGEWSHD